MGVADAAFSRRLAQNGWVGMAIPTEYGGQGQGAVARFVVTEELLAAGAPVAYHWIADRQVAPAILRHGSESQRRHYLPSIARAEFSFGLCMSESDAGSDLAAVRTRAERVDDGWELHGTKLWTTGAHTATHLSVLARTNSSSSKHEGLSQFLLSLPHPRITINPIQTMDGASHFNEVVFDHALIGHNSLLGTIDNGWHQVTSELVNERAGPERVMSTLPLLREWAALHPQPVDAQVDVGMLFTRLVILRLLGLAVAATVDEGGDAAVLAAMLKSMGTTFEGTVLDVIRLHRTDRPDLESFQNAVDRCLIESPAFTLRGGANEILRSIVAKALLPR
jgi:alkylation response protein AidB-like acyl-CoA dehydrogenase